MAEERAGAALPFGIAGDEAVLKTRTAKADGGAIDIGEGVEARSGEDADLRLSIALQVNGVHDLDGHGERLGRGGEWGERRHETAERRGGDGDVPPDAVLEVKEIGCTRRNEIGCDANADASGELGSGRDIDVDGGAAELKADGR